MTVVSRALRTVALAAAISVSFSFAASADDFLKECKISNPGSTADKVCGCMSDKIKGAERPNAIDAMNKTNAAAKGSNAAAAGMNEKVMKSMEVVMTAQVACM